MGIQNLGSQIITFNYKQPATGEGFSQLLPNLLNQGIYSGFQVQNVTSTTITLTPGAAVLYSYDTGVTPNLLIANSIKTTQNATISGFSSTNVYCVLRYQWSNVASNYMDILAVSTVQANDVVVCKLIYTGSNVTDIDYSFRTFGNLDTTKLMYDYSGANFYINPGTKFWYINNFVSNAKIISYYEVNQKITTGLTAPGSSGSYYIYYNGTSFGIATVASITATYSSSKDGWYSGEIPDKKLLFKFDTDGSSNIINVRILQDGILSMTSGGTGAQLVPSNGGILYSTANTLAVLVGTATAGQILRSGANVAPSWSTATYPSTASSAGTILRADGTNWVATTAAYPATAGTSGTIMQSNGTNWVATTMTYLATSAQGDIFYASAANTMAALAKSSTANSFLKNSGTSNNPAWATIAASDLSNGVTGSGSVVLASSPVITGALTMQQWANTAFTDPYISTTASRGTVGTPLALQINDYIFQYQHGGRDDSGYVHGFDGGFLVTVQATEDWTSTKHGTQVIYSVTPTGSQNPATLLTLYNASVGIGPSSTAPVATLAIGGNGTAGQALYATSATADAIRGVATSQSGFGVYGTCSGSGSSPSIGIKGEGSGSTGTGFSNILTGNIGVLAIGNGGSTGDSFALWAVAVGTGGRSGTGGYFNGSTYDIYLWNYTIGNIYGKTSTSGIALYVNSSGQVGTSTSSRRFKTHVVDLDQKYIDAFLKIRTTTYNYKSSYSKSDFNPIQFGWIAEEVEELMPEWVNKDENGVPDAIYENFINRVSVAVIQNLNTRLSILENSHKPA